MRHDSASGGVDADLILVGGGLANGLIAWRLRMRRPGLRVLMVESGQVLGGKHTWAFQDADIDAAQRAWLAPMVSHHWPQHEVIFPGHRRLLPGGYSAVTSSHLDAVLRCDLPGRVLLNAPVAALGARNVQLANGRQLRAHAVIDGRGAPANPHLSLGSQQFLGQELRLAAPHGLKRPILMDAAVAQNGGCRFVCVLPLATDTLFVQDNIQGEAGAANAERLRANVAGYVQARGWKVAELLREEQGELPIVLGGHIKAFWREANGVARSGLAAGLFHPATGCRLPDAVRLADLIAALPDLSAAPLFEAVRGYATSRWQSQGFLRTLNRMMAGPAAASQRWHVMQRLHGLPAPVIGRFYAGSPGLMDKARILCARAPLPLRAAMHVASP